MNKKLFISDKYSDSKEYIRITHSGFYFCSEFVKSNHLENSNSVRFYEFNNNIYKFGLEFSKELEIAGGFSLLRNRAQKYGFATAARSFINNSNVLKDLIIDPKSNNRFLTKYDKNEGCFIFNVIPSFEFKEYPSSIPEGITGIYRYKDTLGNILYIGKGNIKDRMRSPERKSWGIHTVEYSVIEDKEEMSQYESFHINEYKKQYNNLPQYNIISGVRL